MKYHVVWSNSELYVCTKDYDAMKRDDELHSSRWNKYIVCKLPYTQTNKAEMKQHAEKIAEYFEQVDTAKEAVIRCTKI